MYGLQPEGSRGRSGTRRRGKRVKQTDPHQTIGEGDKVGGPSEFFQTTLQEGAIPQDEFYGNRMEAKPNGVFRLAFQNIGRLPVSSKTARSKTMVAQIAAGEYDVLLMAEVGLCHCKLEPADQWGERIIGVLEDMSAYFAYNTNELETSEAVQYGGVGIIATAEARHRIIRSNKDKSGLGRWISVSIQGKEGHVTTCFSVYRPCFNPDRVGSVYMQHIRALPPLADPRQAVFDDLGRAIQDALDKGEHIIVGMDVNSNILQDPAKGFFQALGLREAISTHHVPLAPPETQRMNKNRYPIDGLWVSPSITVSRCGYSGYDDYIPSDHRCLWMDIQYSIAFGQRCPPIVRPTGRRLKSSDPRLVKKYVKRLKKVFRATRLAEQLQSLEDQARVSGWTPKLEKKYNTIHLESLKIRQIIETRLRKLPMGGVPWSPKLQVFRDRIALWEMMVRRGTKEKVSLSRIRRFIKKTGEQEALLVTLEDALDELDKAYRSYKRARSNAENWRYEHQENLISALAAQNNTTKATEIKNMKLQEQQRKVSRKIKRARGKLGMGRVTKVYTKDEEGTKVECSDKLSMEAAIIQENEYRFSQSEGTPPLEYPLLDDMGFFGETNSALEVLEGTYPIPESLPKYTQEFLKALQKPQAVIAQGDVSTQLSVEEHCWAWRRQKEGKSAEPTSPSFSHYKAGATDPLIATFDCLIRALPYQFGFSPAAWRRITDVSILKKAGIFCVDQMRTIQLMFSEFNMNNKKLGRDVMKSAEKAGVIPPDQYGSRKKHRCIMAALNKRLTMDILRQCVIAGALCANDAKSCYDRIVHWVAVLALCWAGLPREPAISMFSTLAFSIHFISTAYGISLKSYGRNRTIFLQGVGQGNGSGPAVWAVISAVLIRMMYAAGHGANLITPISMAAVSFVCYAFVDDTDIIETGKSRDSSGEDVAKQMQQAIDRWEGGLRSTGGALVPGKSHWYLIDFAWSGGRWVYRQCFEMPATLSVVDTCGTKRVTLKRHEVWHAEETLGVKLSMDGNNDDQIHFLIDKATKLTDQLRVSKLDKNDVWYAIQRVIMPSLEYCSPAVTIQKADWNRIMSPILRYLLPKAGYDPHFPRRILYAPLEYQGAGLVHPWHRQEILHLCTLVSECMSGSLTGKLLLHSLEALRLEVGLSGLFWDYQFVHFAPIITDSWMASLWSYTSKHKIRVIDPAATLKTFWTTDQLLMDVFSARYSGEALRRLNMCRMYLQVATLSDIATCDGSFLSYNAWHGIKSDTWSLYEWPRRPPTIPADWWDLWRQALTKCFCSSTNRSLKLHLGEALGRPERWRWYYSAVEDCVYHQEGAFWRAYPKRLMSRVTRKQLKPRFMRATSLSTPPIDIAPIRIKCFLNSPFIAVDGEHLQVHESPNQISTKQVDAHSHRAFNRPTSTGIVPVNTTFVAEWEMMAGTDSQLANAIALGKCLVVSDGSFKHGRCTSAFTIQSLLSTAQGLGVNALPGGVRESDSFRGEVGGVIGALEMVRWICQTHEVSSGSLTLALDGEEAMNKCSSTEPVAPNQSSFDLLQVVHSMVQSLPIKVHWQWVRGHQSGSRRSQASLLNELCDKTAKAYWQHCYDHKLWRNGESLGEGWQIWMGNDKVSSLSADEIYSWAVLFDDDLSPQEYWERKHHISREEFHTIDWEGVGKAAKSLPTGTKRWLTKFLTGFLGTNQRLNFRGLSSAECPRCPEPVEDARHVVRCQGSGAAGIWATGVAKLSECMTSLYTCPEIVSAILNRLTEWYYGMVSTPLILEKASRPVRDAVLKQDQLGWHNFVYGRLAIEWRQAQHAYYLYLKRSNSSRRWVEAIVKKLWDISWDMWSHRNGVKMAPTHPSQASILQSLRSEILEKCMTDSADWTPQERLLLVVPHDRLSSWSINQLRSWLASFEAINKRVKARLRKRFDETSSMRRFLRSWLSSGSGKPANLG